MNWIGWTWRELRRRPARTLLTLFGVVIGVAAFVATWMTAATAKEAASTMFAALGGHAELEVRAVGQAGLAPDLIDSVRQTAGVRQAVPLVRGSAALRVRSGLRPVAILGIDPRVDRAIRSLEVRSGRPLDEGSGAWLDTAFARGEGIEVGADLALVARGGRRRIPVVGLLAPSALSAFDAGGVVVLSLEQAQDLLRLPDRLTAVQVVVDDGANADAVAAALRKRLPPGHEVAPPAEAGALARDTMRSVEHGLAAVSVMSLVAGAFIVLNTVLMSTGERRRSLALLRALGLRRGQVMTLLLRESLLLALLGTGLGIAAGLGTASAMVGSLDRFLGLRTPGVRIDATPFLLAALLGPAMALLATWLPARAAAARPVLAELFPARRILEDHVPAGLTRTGFVMLGLALLVLAGFVTGTVTEAFIAPAMGLTLVGFVLVLPRIVPILVRGVAGLVERVAGIEGRLAVRHLGRRPLRTSLTAGVLMLAIIVGIGMGHAIRGNIRAFGRWYEETLTADFFVRAAMPDTATVSAPLLPPEAKTDIQALGGVARVVEVTFLPVRVNDERALLIARTVTPDQALSFGVTTGDPEAVRDGLVRGEAGVGVFLAQKLGLTAGDDLTLGTQSGPRRLRVAGVITSYTVGGSTLFLARHVAEPLFELEGAHALLVDAAPQARAEAARSLARYADRRGILVQTNEGLRRTVDDLLGGVLGLLQGLLVLVFAVAALGVANTLTMNVLEQTRELGLLRAIAMTRRQIRKFVRAQALVLALLSLPPGVVAGMLLAAVLDVAMAALSGFRVAYAWDGWLLAACAGLALLTVVLGAILPARRAARLRIFEALAYE